MLVLERAFGCPLRAARGGVLRALPLVFPGLALIVRPTRSDML